MRSDLSVLADAIKANGMLTNLIFRDPASEFEKNYCPLGKKIAVAVYDKVDNCLLFSIRLAQGKFHKVLSAEYCKIMQSMLSAVRTSPELQFAFNVLNETARKAFRVVPDAYTYTTSKQLFMNTLRHFLTEVTEATEKYVERAFHVFVHTPFSSQIVPLPKYLPNLTGVLSSSSLFAVKSGEMSSSILSEESADKFQRKISAGV